MSQQTHDEGTSAAWGGENRPRARSVTCKVATILKAFAGQSCRTMTEVAQYACLPGSTAYRLLKELVGCGLLDRGTDGHYHIGPAMYQLATDSYSPADEAQAHIGRILHDLELVTGYRARYGVLRGRGVGYVERGGGPPDWLRPAPAVGPTGHS